MEEKERFEYYPEQNQLYDNIINELYCLGIEQDKTRLVDFLNLMNKDWRTLYERNIELREENQQLKQQLAEKDKEIEKYRDANIIVVGERSQGKKHLMEIKIKELQNQKAIEQLEQIINLFEPYENEEKDTILCANNGISFLEYIDNQINELKGVK